MRYANTTVNGAGANESKSEVSSADSRMKNVMIYPMFNFPDLSDSYDPDFQLTNPITSVYDTDRKQNRQTFNMNGSFLWEIFKNFKFKTEFGLDWYYNTDKKDVYKRQDQGPLLRDLKINKTPAIIKARGQTLSLIHISYPSPPQCDPRGAFFISQGTKFPVI